jgi:ribosomal protein L11 methyltransferase
MKNVSKKSWFSLSIELNSSHNLDFLYSQFYNDMVGATENQNEFIFYFECDKKKNIYSILNNKLMDYKFKMEDIKYQNWHTSYEKYFKPIKVNENLMVVPDWYKINNTDNMDYIRIIPGMAFGTGHHETTQLIIESLVDNININDSVLDLGSGSGILSIAALKFGASEVMAIEYDEDCKDNFYENMALNSINTKYTLSIEDVLLYKDYNYDLIIANINKNVIIDLLPNIKKFQKKKFKIILSGLLVDDQEDIIQIISRLDFKIIEQTQMGEWICILLN